VLDLKIGRSGITRSVIRYKYNTYRCDSRWMEMTLHSRRGTKYGPNLRAYIVHLLIELRMSTQKIKEHVATVFNIVITKAMVINTKLMMARKYEETYQQILKEIANGPLVHADETKGVVYGGGHYVWIFATNPNGKYVAL
jgi:transposase